MRNHVPFLLDAVILFSFLFLSFILFSGAGRRAAMKKLGVFGRGRNE
jgi:hypothetical protein